MFLNYSLLFTNKSWQSWLVKMLIFECMHVFFSILVSHCFWLYSGNTCHRVTFVWPIVNPVSRISVFHAIFHVFRQNENIIMVLLHVEWRNDFRHVLKTCWKGSKFVYLQRTKRCSRILVMVVPIYAIKPKHGTDIHNDI